MITIEQLKTRHKEICDAALKLVEQRGNEYAVNYDTLRTFRRAASFNDYQPSEIADVMIAIKISRMFNNDSENIPYDSIMDCINYLVYKVVLMEEEKH